MKARVVNVNLQGDDIEGKFVHEQTELVVLAERKEDKGKSSWYPTDGTMVVLIKNEAEALRFNTGDVVEITFRKTGS